MKKTTKLIPLVLALGLTGLTLTKGAWAETEPSSFQVGIDVVATCSISAADMTFNTITTGTTAQTDSESQITVNCSNGAPYSVALSNGSNYSAGRRLSSNGSFINYTLFKDNSRTAEWTLISSMTGTGSGSNQTLPVYGRIPAGQNVTNMGSYSDTIVATVTY